jgi:glycosyltransferase involved in cell wall biosynthesis
MKKVFYLTGEYVSKPKERPTVDVIVPFHLENNYLEQALDCIAIQVDVIPRVILVDDRVKVSRDYFTNAHHSIIKEIVRTGGGSGYNRALRAGLACVDSQFIAFLDSDDVMKKDRLASQVQSIVNTDADLSISGMWKFGKFSTLPSHPGYLSVVSDFQLPLLLGSYGANSTWVFRSDSIFDLELFSGECKSIDWATALRIFSKLKVTVVKKRLYGYRQHGNQMTRDSLYKQSSFNEIYNEWSRINQIYGLPNLTVNEAMFVSTNEAKGVCTEETKEWMRAYLKLIEDQEPSAMNEVRAIMIKRKIVRLINFNSVSII